MADAEASVTPINQARRLSEAIREVKNAAADRDDVVVEIRDASRVRLELLAQELQPVFDAVPVENDWFDFAISSGLQPRLWIDAISHVTLGRDRRTYRFLADTRLGRTVLAESPEIKPVADQVTRYVAERMVERQRLVEGTVEPVARLATRAKWGSVYRPRRGWRALLHSSLLVAAGAFVGIVFAVAFFWDRLAELGISF
jgi:hypothetical protein